MSWLPEPLRIPNFRAYWLARLAATLAQLAMVTAIEYQVYAIARETMSPAAAAFRLGLVGFVQFVPLFFLSPFAGWAADRIDRRILARASILIEIGCAASLGYFTFTGTISLPIIYAIAVFVGVARVLMGPSMSALASNIVPRSILPNAIALSSIAWQAGTIIGPALGGYLLAVSIETAYFTATGLFILSLFALFMIGEVRQTVADRMKGPLRQIADGLRYVRANRLVLGAISLDLFAVLLGSAVALLPIFAADIFGGGPDLFGHLRAAPAVGATLVAILFAIRPLKTDVGSKMLLAVGIFGLATIGFGLSRSVPLTFLFLIIIGGADMFSVYVRQSLIQLYTPDEMRGRVGAVSTLSISASNELGDAESGLIASLVGPTMAAVIGGVGAVTVVVIWAWKFPELRRAKSFDPPGHDKKEALP
ncbi:MFS transporter [Sphingomicrobium lutaoense]|uniref:MFS family permease n=1 Tax=Sphingomicrobium lutaoense TaxID=515949 RepID=A0A839Z143_9SPHN|nr:MFS transporter [Sphingomicrobium lutaoense]MBB3763295.1 MFS family permease [Sphingomicrobium lutaoense]